MRRLAALAAFFLLANLGGQAFGQTGAADSPPIISLLNPSTETSLIVSEQKAADVTYRLSAWVDDPTVSPLVEFELQQGNNRPITIGTASRATVDTFELLWTVPPWLPEGSYTLRAMLFSGITEVGRDEATISLVASTPSSRRDSTVDITYPSVGGLLGLFESNASTTTAIMQVAVSEDATFVRSFYTTSAPGQAPDWKQCGVESRAQAANGLRCTLQPEDAGASVKAISAVANESDASGVVSSVYDGASDAKRITTYTQRVESLTVNPSNQTVHAGADGLFPCSQAISASVFDQVGRPIAGANVDAHGVGPTDQLAFDTGTASAPTTSVAPDQGHVAYETGYSCNEAGQAALPQGEHNIPGAADLKHVESISAGTDDEGKFSIRVYSPDAGATQLQIWVDETEDDTDTGELSLAASIDWGGVVPPPPPPPDPEPQPPFERAISLASDKEDVRKGGRVRLGGVIASDASECVSNQEVRLRVRGPNGRHFRTIASTSSDDQGVFIFNLRAFKTRYYRAVAPSSDTCLKARSDTVTVSVRKGG